MGRVEPLFEVFLTVRERLSLSVQDYLLVCESLASGFGSPSRDELRLVCQTVWAKNREQQTFVARVLDSHLPGPWRHTELPRDDAVRDTPDFLKPPPRDPDGILPTPSSSLKPGVGGLATPIGGAMASVLAEGAAVELATRTESVARAAAGARRRLPFDLEGALPVSRRHMQRAWRYYRRLRRQGPAVELDLTATVEEVHRSGVFHGAVLLPRRRNLASLLVLVDSSASMRPFEREIGPLLETSRSREGGLVRAEIAWFRNEPGPTLFLDAALLRPINDFAAFTEPFLMSGILIVSDAGAARGHCNEARTTITLRELDRLRAVTPNLAWLNPTPPERWNESTAGHIQRYVPMFPLERSGLDHAVEVLRGRRAH